MFIDNIHNSNQVLRKFIRYDSLIIITYCKWNNGLLNMSDNA